MGKKLEQTLSEALIDISSQMEMQWIAIDGIDFTRSVDNGYSEFMLERFLENMHGFLQKASQTLDFVALELEDEKQAEEELKKVLKNQKIDENGLKVDTVYQDRIKETNSHWLALLSVYHLGKVTGIRQERQRRAKA